MIVSAEAVSIEGVGSDAVLIAVVSPEREVDIVGVVGYEKFGALRRRRAVVGLVLGG